MTLSLLGGGGGEGSGESSHFDILIIKQLLTAHARRTPPTKLQKQLILARSIATR